MRYGSPISKKLPQTMRKRYIASNAALGTSRRAYDSPTPSVSFAMRTVLKIYSAFRHWGFHPLRANRKGEYAIRITGRLRLIVEYDANSRTVFVKEVTDHYED